jgi:hypothetical protein
MSCDDDDDDDNNNDDDDEGLTEAETKRLLVDDL